ncbi:MAG TPA: hypothetical protein PK970_13435 [Hyphomicrobiaceae bacterium]|nr:hypothetical protein [Hyphomicrobiaceae bacterium]
MSLRRMMMVAVVAASAVLAVAAVPVCPVAAQGASCSDACKAAFGACYKSTANRAACESQLQRCLQGCISARR